MTRDTTAENESDRTEHLIRQILELLHQSNKPLSTRAINEKIDSRGMDETKKALRRMIDRKLVKPHPSFRYGLSSKARRSLQTETDQ